VDAQILRRKVIPTLLLLGAGLGISYTLRDAPREQEFELRFEGRREGLIRVEAGLIGPEGEEEASARWQWGAGKAPAAVRGRFKAAPGRWRVRILLETAAGARLEERTLELGGGVLRVPVRVE